MHRPAASLLIGAALPCSSRSATLKTAFPDIDRRLPSFIADGHVPGAAWGIIIDVERAHVGVAGKALRPAPDVPPRTDACVQ